MSKGKEQWLCYSAWQVTGRHTCELQTLQYICTQAHWPQKGIWAGVVICLEQGADMHMAIVPFSFPFTRTHTFNGLFFRVSRYQKGKTNLDFTEATDSEWQWHQMGHMQVCTLLQTDNHASTPPLSYLQARCPSCHPNSVNAHNFYCWSCHSVIADMLLFGWVGGRQWLVVVCVGDRTVSLLRLSWSTVQTMPLHCSHNSACCGWTVRPQVGTLEVYRCFQHNLGYIMPVKE